MDYKNLYVVLYREEEVDESALKFFEEKGDLEQFIAGQHKKRTLLNQRYSYFLKVFDKGSVYPTDYDSFWKERRNPNRNILDAGAGFFIQKTLKNGSTKAKYYQNAENFDWQLGEWKSKGAYDIIILNLAEAHNGDYYYDREIAKKWREKELPLIS